jgi:DNA invertase Pin-like site-specific DNA recombinase
MERRFVLERQRAGIDAAKKKGVYKGRKPTVPTGVVRQMRAEGKMPGALQTDQKKKRKDKWLFTRTASHGSASPASGARPRTSARLSPC